jgi:hypothetical protein
MKRLTKKQREAIGVRCYIILDKANELYNNYPLYLLSNSTEAIMEVKTIKENAFNLLCKINDYKDKKNN